MAETLNPARVLKAPDAKRRLSRLGAVRCEPARLSLWAVGVGRDERSLTAWLIAAEPMPRALLLPATLPASPHEAERVLTLSGGPCPATEEFQKRWLWERLAAPRRWPLRVQPASCRPIALPLWLGYGEGPSVPLSIVSGLSGEPLTALKPVVLSALRAQSH